MFGATEIYFGTKVKIDKRLRDEILKEFSGDTIRYHYEVMNEVWLTVEELSKQIQFFSKSWLKDNGHYLPREHVVYEDKKGVEHKSSWCYPLHRIRRMVAEGQIHFHVKSDKEETTNI